ncbi:putative pyruvate carboxylase [Aspergillus brunneoviolaceus CBS 621.78]|uniref:Pyruvate carboxylase n=1 Tax=Aspergillus brunneoviolaceus CBS 621.78 TaxID=1450534 RepID=A0ACD1GE74_9EURO|nr:pyruvate carboxylase [Aspergillus brunneoviolaceus CBS 621.78]RAH47589.1 pyruvate carboxylase [Aspergillus brunneoviolaceus CBS 621.78]
MSRPRPFTRLLVANRGEIAVRIIHAARELSPPIQVLALYTEHDRSHCDLGRPDQEVLVESPTAYLDIPLLIRLAKEHAVEAVHPGYGFLSESADFARRMHDVGVTVVGPGWETLARTGDKLQAKQLAVECGVPVLPATPTPAADIALIRDFARQVQYPVMIKAVDGGGGRGIRLVRDDGELERAVDAAMAESPSRTVFAEKAAVDGYRHIEVQVVGDGLDVCQLGERDCSVQRRFQKIIEMAPSLILDRTLVQQVLDAALRMARAIRYRSLGTVEFLVNEKQGQFYFLEINPRLQVEHTITEAIHGIDLVQIQLRLAQGNTLAQTGLEPTSLVAPRLYSMQLRLCAEDPHDRFSLSSGKVTEFMCPGGNGVRVDTHVNPTSGEPVTVGTQFDNLLAKIIVTATSWDATVLKARRVLADTRISGIRTNLDLLCGVTGHDDFLSRRIDNQWLESRLTEVLHMGSHAGRGHREKAGSNANFSSLVENSASNPLLRGGDAWSVVLEPLHSPQKQPQGTDALRHHLRLTRVLQNDFPSSLAAEVEYTTATSSAAYRLQLAATTTAASALVSSTQRRGDTRNPRHIVLPLSGRLIEILVATGDQIAKDQVVAFVKQMKMEVEIRSPRAGRAHWVYEMEDDEDEVAEGMLLVELEGSAVKGKL